ncbi:hypothetical protein Vretifemale_8661 [Volvox reticuliferus]|uniref:Uncharacterized protein n=1 Tax=Volvox reticuliferus TaxID=1737510 RepID=A0A8J4CBL4_9CHLO|nr:hypothetical protein Vretifemale_8661 [Volvox reticuliferus]
MQATTQQALKWRWFSPNGIHAVVVATSPAFIRAASTPPAASVGHLVAPVAWSGNVANPVVVSGKSTYCPAVRPCTTCCFRSNVPANCTSGCKHGDARLRTRKSSTSSLALAGSSPTAIIKNPVAVMQARRTAAGSNGKTYPSEYPASIPDAQVVLDHGGKQGAPPRRTLSKVMARCFTSPPLRPARCGTGIGSGTRDLSMPSMQHQQYQHQEASALARAELHQSALSAAADRRLTVTAASATGSYSSATSAYYGRAPVSLPTRHIVAAVDPDLNGALALIYWDADPSPAALLRPPLPSPRFTTPASHAAPGVAANCGVGGAASSEPGTSMALPAWQVGDSGWLMVMPTHAGSTQGRAVSSGSEAAVEVDDEEEEERGRKGDNDEKLFGVSGGANVAAAVQSHELRVPAPPAPPADPSLWTVRVWDMPVSAAERQKPTATGGISRRRLLHVAGARAVLANALACALPPPEEHRRVALYGYVEVPPILPGDGNISAYTSLWSTGAWLGLLTGMGFTVGSTPVRRWKQDMGLYGARSKDAGLTLARVLFPGQARILKHKKNHGRADALLIAAWALGASLPPRLAGTLRRNHMTVDELLAEQPAVRLAWGPPRPPTPTDAYGNLLSPERDMMDEIEAAEARVDRLEEARAAKKAGRPKGRAAAAALAAAGASCADADADVATVPAITTMTTSGTGATAVRRSRRKKSVIVAAGPGEVGGGAGGEVEVGVGMGGDEQTDLYLSEGEGAGSCAPRRNRKTKEAGRAPEAEVLETVDAAAAAFAAQADSSAQASAPVRERSRGRGRPPKKVTMEKPAGASRDDARC